MDYKGLRIKAGLSLNDVAVRTGYSKSQVVKAESGEIVPSVRYEQAFARAIQQCTLPLDKQVPITRAVQELGARSAKAKSILAEVKPALNKANDLITLFKGMLELVDTIASQQANNDQDNQSDINLAEASPETVNEAQNDISSTLERVLRKWNIHKLPKDAQKGSVKYLVDEVLGNIQKPSHAPIYKAPRTYRPDVLP